MILLKNCKLEFRELNEGEHLYDDVDIHTYSVVSAQYEKRDGYEHIPDICALPRLYQNRDLIQATTIGLPEYNPQAIEKMKPYERKENILLLQKPYFPLEHIFEIASAINKALVSSYMARESRYSEYQEEVFSVRNNEVGRPYSFLVTGLTGCGKSAAVRQINNLYPDAIRHELDGKEYIQIPILMTTTMVGNMLELVTAFAVKIDEILDMGTYYADRIRKRRNVGMACNLLKEWIKQFHIGLLIIDEVQFMSFGDGNSSFENLVGIAEDTGCSLGLIGNNDLNQKLYKYPRIVNRIMSSRIEVSCNDEVSLKFFVNAVNRLWEYQWTKERTPMTEEIRRQLVDDSMCNIAMLKALLIQVQYEAIKKFPTGGITPEYIHKIAEKGFSEMQTLLLQDTPDSERKILELFQNKSNSILEDAKKQEKKARAKDLDKSNDGNFSVENEWKIGQVQNILTFTDDYTESMIKRAIKLASVKNPGLQNLDVKQIAYEAKQILDSRKPDIKVRMAKKKTVNEEVEAAVREAMRPELKGSEAV